MNHFGHIEIPTTDFKIAKKFFGGVFNWKFQEIPEMDYVLFRAGMKPNGGFFKVKKMPKTGQVNVYIEVKDINTTLKKIQKLGGTVIVKKSPVAKMGWFAMFTTPDGCHLCLWQIKV
ncbi:MAG: VOC family protein [Bacteroidota bacterium]|nr:VOC family protein [Bacteroidota bacterium]